MIAHFIESSYLTDQLPQRPAGVLFRRRIDVGARLFAVPQAQLRPDPNG